MPIKLIPPQKGRSKNYRIRGMYLGVSLDRTTETSEKALAQQIYNATKRKIERGEITGKPELTFSEIALAYIRAGGDAKSVTRLTNYFGRHFAVSDMSQAKIDEAAEKLFPKASPATRNRWVYTPISAIYAHNHLPLMLNRPKGAAGQQRTCYLTQEQFQAVRDELLKIDQEFAIYLTLVVFTGLRKSEALSILCSDIHFDRETIFVGKTKNGEPRAVYIPPAVIAALSTHPRGMDRAGRLFDRFQPTGGAFYKPLHAAYAAAKVDDGGAPIHILRHSFGRWMTQIGADLVATNVWRSQKAASVYQHFQWNEEAAKAKKLPGAGG